MRDVILLLDLCDGITHGTWAKGKGLKAAHDPKSTAALLRKSGGLLTYLRTSGREPLKRVKET